MSKVMPSQRNSPPSEPGPPKALAQLRNSSATRRLSRDDVGTLKGVCILRVIPPSASSWR